MILKLFLLLAFCPAITLAAKNNSSNNSKNNDDSNKSSSSNKKALIYPEGYNVNLPPEGNRTVWISHVVRDIADVNDKDFSITFILETMIGWNDDRIKVNEKLWKGLPENSP